MIYNATYTVTRVTQTIKYLTNHKAEWKQWIPTFPLQPIKCQEMINEISKEKYLEI